MGSPRVGGPRRALVTPGRPGGRAPEEGGSGQRKRPGAHGSPAPARRAAVPLRPAAQRGLRARGLRGSSSGVGACVPQPRARLALPRPGTSAVCRVSRGSASVRCVRPRRNSEARPQGGRNRGACTPARPPPRRAGPAGERGERQEEPATGGGCLGEPCLPAGAPRGGGRGCWLAVPCHLACGPASGPGTSARSEDNLFY